MCFGRTIYLGAEFIRIGNITYFRIFHGMAVGFGRMDLEVHGSLTAVNAGIHGGNPVEGFILGSTSALSNSYIAGVETGNGFTDAVLRVTLGSMVGGYTNMILGGNFADGARNAARIMLMNEMGNVVMDRLTKMSMGKAPYDSSTSDPQYVTERARGAGVKAKSLNIDYVALQRGSEIGVLASMSVGQWEISIIFAGISEYAGYMQGPTSVEVIRDGCFQYITAPLGVRGQMIYMLGQELMRR